MTKPEVIDFLTPVKGMTFNVSYCDVCGSRINPGVDHGRPCGQPESFVTLTAIVRARHDHPPQNAYLDNSACVCLRCFEKHIRPLMPDHPIGQRKAGDATRAD